MCVMLDVIDAPPPLPSRVEDREGGAVLIFVEVTKSCTNKDHCQQRGQAAPRVKCRTAGPAATADRQRRWEARRRGAQQRAMGNGQWAMGNGQQRGDSVRHTESLRETSYMSGYVPPDRVSAES